MQRKTTRHLTRFPWDDVHLFLVLYRSRTMKEAAAVLRVNTSTVSRRLTALEEALDAALFDRGRDGLSPTRSAEELLVAAEQTEAAVASFANLADGLERDVSGVVRIACPPDMADVTVLPMLRPLLDQHPRLRVVLSPGEGTVDLIRREADLAIRTIRPTRGDLLARRVLTIDWIPSASPALAARFSPMTDLTQIPWISWGPRFSRVPASQWIARYGGEPILQTDSLITQIGGAREGIGVALVPGPSVAHYGLIPLQFADPDSEPSRRCPRNALFLVTHRTLRGVPRVKVVWEALRSSIQARFGSP